MNFVKIFFKILLCLAHASFVLIQTQNCLNFQILNFKNFFRTEPNDFMSFLSDFFIRKYMFVLKMVPDKSKVYYLRIC